ncbi:MULTISPECIES: hypothetical protein [Novosphingobium]|uniref:hypothetical protein n=1 Tax=Novosphingobium TaxID=165696 RepID=UPI0022F2484E|nr:hypothetical protein [Novosphingobium resinovorum]
MLKMPYAVFQQWCLLGFSWDVAALYHLKPSLAQRQKARANHIASKTNPETKADISMAGEEFRILSVITMRSGAIKVPIQITIVAGYFASHKVNPYVSPTTNINIANNPDGISEIQSIARKKRVRILRSSRSMSLISAQNYRAPR